MKRAALAAVMLSCLAVHLSSQPNKSTRAGQQRIQQQNPPETATVVKNCQCASPANSATNKSPRWYATPEGALVIVGICTFLVIGWQSWETRRSADAAKKSAA